MTSSTMIPVETVSMPDLQLWSDEAKNIIFAKNHNLMRYDREDEKSRAKVYLLVFAAIFCPLIIVNEIKELPLLQGDGILFVGIGGIILAVIVGWLVNRWLDRKNNDE